MGLTTSGHTKSIGDVFETIAGAYYTEKGYDALYEWMKRTYDPIIPVAVNAFHEQYVSHRCCHACASSNIHFKLQKTWKRRGGSFHPDGFA